MEESDSVAAEPTEGNDHSAKHSVHEDVRRTSLESLQIGRGGRAQTQRRLRNYQITWIGFCAGIGVGHFVAVGAAYAGAGPAGLLLAFALIAIVQWCVMQSIAEIATLFPTAGSFHHFATRFIDPAVGFSLAISHAYRFAIAIASEVRSLASHQSLKLDISLTVAGLGIRSSFLASTLNMKSTSLF